MNHEMVIIFKAARLPSINSRIVYDSNHLCINAFEFVSYAKRIVYDSIFVISDDESFSFSFKKA